MRADDVEIADVCTAVSFGVLHLASAVAGGPAGLTVAFIVAQGRYRRSTLDDAVAAQGWS